MSYKDIKGNKYNMLTAVEFVRSDPKGAIWRFRCDCGNYVECFGHSVTSKSSKRKSCGCLLHSIKDDITGKKFNKLTVLGFDHRTGRRRMIWKCQCDCGNIVYVDGTHLKNGHTKSCGCINIERIGNLNKKTGEAGTRIYFVYHNMHMRCEREVDDQYKNYGGRGIRVCDEWSGENGFENFLRWAQETGYDPNAKRGECTLDRIDVNGNYSPDNCRWATQLEQCNNKRNTLRISINGEVDTVTNMVRKYGLNYDNLRHYAKGGRNEKYPHLKIEAVKNEL